MVSTKDKGKEPMEEDLQDPKQGLVPLVSCPASTEALRVTKEFCDKYRDLRRKVDMLQWENNRLRKMLEDFLTSTKKILPPPPPKE